MLSGPKCSRRIVVFYFVRTVLSVLFGLCVFFPQIAKADADTERVIVSGGIIVAEKALLMAEPDRRSKAIKELPFGTPFYILGGKEDISRWRPKKWPLWFQILLRDKKTSGWVTSKQGRESEFWDERMQENDFAGLYYSVARISRWSYEEYDTAERLFRHILKGEPDAQVIYDDGGGLGSGDARTQTLKSLAEMYKARKEYKRSIKYYHKIETDKKSTESAKAEARWNILEIYRREMKDCEKTLEASYATIKEFPNRRAILYELCVWPEIVAAQYIRSCLREESASPQEYIRHGQKVISTSENPAVKVIGHTIVCEGYRKLGEYERIKETVSAIIDRWPTTRVIWRKDGNPDYSANAVFFAVKSLIEDLEDYDQAEQFCEHLVSRTDNDRLLQNLLFIKAYILEMGPAARETVISAYERSVLVYIYHDSLGYNTYRLREITAFEEYEARVGVPRLLVKSRPTESAKDLFTLVRGDTVAVLYRTRHPYEDDWVKIQVGEDKFGWVRRRSLSK